MLIARDKDTDELRCIVDYEAYLKPGTLPPFPVNNLVCNVTGHRVAYKPAYFKQGKRIRGHFSAIPSTGEQAKQILAEFCGDSEIFRMRGEHLYYGSESIEHIEGKLAVAEFLSDRSKVHRKLSPLYEHQLKLVDGRTRIIDLAYVLPSGQIEAHEIQFSAISIAELEAKAFDYASHGVTCFYWFGGNAATEQNINWWIENFHENPLLLNVVTQSEEAMFSRDYSTMDTKNVIQSDAIVKRKPGRPKKLHPTQPTKAIEAIESTEKTVTEKTVQEELEFGLELDLEFDSPIAKRFEEFCLDEIDENGDLE